MKMTPKVTVPVVHQMGFSSARWCTEKDSKHTNASLNGFITSGLIGRITKAKYAKILFIFFFVQQTSGGKCERGPKRLDPS